MPQFAADPAKILVTPDPVTDISFLKVPGPPGDFLLEIFSQSGRLLQKRNIRSEDPVTIRAALFRPGLYFFGITKKNGSVFAGRFIVIR